MFYSLQLLPGKHNQDIFGAQTTPETLVVVFSSLTVYFRKTTTFGSLVITKFLEETLARYILFPVFSLVVSIKIKPYK